MLGWMKERLARRAALLSAVAVAVGVIGPYLLLGAPADSRALVLAVLLVMAPLAAVATGFYADTLIGARLRTLTAFLRKQAEPSANPLARLPALGADEIGDAARAANELLSHLTDVHVSMIDQGQELREAQEALALKAQIEKKSRELEARLQERAVLFDVLEESTRRPDLDKMLASVAPRLGAALRLRELAVLVRDGGDLVIRATHGFDRPERVLGRVVKQGEGVAGKAVDSLRPVLVSDVRVDSRYLAFWGEVERDGSFVLVPVVDGETRVGMLAFTRPDTDPISPEELRFMGAVADTLALAIRHSRQVEELRSLSTHDELTGLANRRLFRSRLDMEIERSARFGNEVSVLAIDIDHFKQLNDRCGHAVGDEALRMVAQLFGEKVRRVDTVARVGGEEFVIVLPRTTGAQALTVAENLRAAVEKKRVPGAEGQPGGRLTISVGVAEYAEGEDATDLLVRADTALYAAKAAGRNRVVIGGGSRERSLDAE